MCACACICTHLYIDIHTKNKINIYVTLFFLGTVKGDFDSADNVDRTTTSVYKVFISH